MRSRIETSFYCGVAAWLLSGCAESPMSEPAALATPHDPPAVSREVVRDAEPTARTRMSPIPAATAGEAGKAGMPGTTAATAQAAAGTSGHAGASDDDDAGIAGAGGMAGRVSVPALTGNDVYLEEGVRPDGVRRCYTKESNAHPAIVRFRQVFYSADYAARDDVIQQLEAAAKEHPQEEQYVLFLGMANLWRLKEPHDLRGLLQIPESALNTEAALERAYALCPTDHRIAGWLGPTKIIMGELAGDTALRDEGLVMLRDGVEHYRNFVAFSYVMIYADLPPGDPQFKQAVQEFATLFSLPLETNDCNQWKLDPACINSPTALYNVEAGAVYAGDLFARAQDREAAIAWYNTAKESPAWTHPAWNQWRHRELLEERIRTVDQRMKTAASPSTADDLESVWNAANACTICHAK